MNSATQHTPGPTWDDIVRFARRVREDRAYARECRRAGNYYDAREAERDARAYEARLRRVADAALAHSTHPQEARS